MDGRDERCGVHFDHSARGTLSLESRKWSKGG
jgi:hypothetical protein